MSRDRPRPTIAVGPTSERRPGRESPVRPAEAGRAGSLTGRSHLYVPMRCARAGAELTGHFLRQDGAWCLAEAWARQAARDQGRSGATRSAGRFEVAASYGGCPACGCRSYVRCGCCGELTCWAGWEVTPYSRCAWCYAGGLVRHGIEDVRVADWA